METPQFQIKYFTGKDNKKVNKAVKKFYDAIKAGKPKPSIFSMVLFLFTRGRINKLSPYFDYLYYRDHGWFSDDVYYYYDPETNFARKGLARLLSKFMGLIGI